MKASRTRKFQTSKTNYMNGEAFADLKQALEDALAFERGERRDLKVTRIQAPRPPKTLLGYEKNSTALKRCPALNSTRQNLSDSVWFEPL